ncbi:MAG: hypothetical protein ACFB2X_11700 [Rivularia sp. (in: cyanobacteria)]
MTTDTLTKNKHIALWTCPRSRSTLITRAFEQLDGCIVFDEPLYGAYLLTHGFDHPHRQEMMDYCESNYQKVIQKITGDLPNGGSFSFQKHISKHALPEFGQNWLKSLHNFFLIRNPKEIAVSWHKVYGKVTKHDLGMVENYKMFKEIEALTGTKPLVIDSTDFVKNPKKVLNILCSHLGLEFSEKMLSWQPGLKNSQLLFTAALSSFAPTWYSTVMNSSGFIPYEEKQVNLPSEFKALVEECQPFYEEMYQYRLIVEDASS